jgi:transposase
MTAEALADIFTDYSRVKEENRILHDELADAKEQIEWFKRQIFGSKSERLIPSDAQMALQLGVVSAQADPQTETITYERQKPRKHTPHGREEIPANLRRETIVLMPDIDVSGMERLSDKVTEQMEYTPPKYWVKRYVRPVFAGYVDGVRTVVCAELPALCNEKGKYGASFISYVTTAKYDDNLPIYRLCNAIRRDSGMEVAETSLDRLPIVASFWMMPVAQRLNEQILKSGYMQMDETSIRVMIKPTNGKSTTGQMWLRHAPELNIVSFTYDRHRNADAAQRLLNGYRGILQTDGYAVYDAYSKSESVIHAGCNAHARRGFEESKNNDKERALHALGIYRELFDIEKDAKMQCLKPDERLLLRKEKSAPLMQSLRQWLDEHVTKVRPKSNIGKAILYCLGRWRELTRFLEDGRIEISNNLIENRVRPFAIGRKNWLFAGSEEAARAMAIILTVHGTCKLHGINFFEYSCYLLEEMPKRKSNDIDDLLPMNWKPTR